jgi:FkbM family methyltransferase
MKVVEIQYGKSLYSLYVDPKDSRYNMVKSKKGTQDGKVLTWESIVNKFPSDKIFDIGCNYGEFLVPIANITNTPIVAFEPNTKVFNCLKETITHFYKLNDNILLNNTAVSNIDDILTLYIPDSSGNASLNKRCVKNKVLNEQSVKVEDISSYLEGCNTFVMKIDVEGEEWKILNRIQEIDNFTNYCIMFEYDRFSDSKKGIVEEFLDGKYVIPISRQKVDLNTFFKYSKDKHSKLEHAHDIIVCKSPLINER